VCACVGGGCGGCILSVFTFLILDLNLLILSSQMAQCSLQCYGTVGWASGRASSLKKMNDEVLVLLSIGGEVYVVCIWFS